MAQLGLVWIGTNTTSYRFPLALMPAAKKGLNRDRKAKGTKANLGS